MIPAPFDYEVAESVDEAVSLLESREDSKLLAGGHSLLPLLRLRFARPALLVDIGRIEKLSYVRDAGASIAIGALTRHHDVATAPLLEEHNPLVAYAAGLIGDPQVRHRGTIGGSLAHADPASDLPAIALALDAEIDIAGRDGVRTVAAADFFLGVFETAVGQHELVTEVRVPKLSGDHVWSYLKFRRRAQDWATVGVAAVARRSNGGVAEPAISLVSMGATPLRAGAAEAAWAAGTDPGAVAGEGTEPPSDTNGSAEYRSHLVQVLVRRAVEEANAR
jgi:aerobic carbon-monoxide dehydrogenase medium subunit